MGRLKKRIEKLRQGFRKKMLRKKMAISEAQNAIDVENKVCDKYKEIDQKSEIIIETVEVWNEDQDADIIDQESDNIIERKSDIAVQTDEMVQPQRIKNLIIKKLHKSDKEIQTDMKGMARMSLHTDMPLLTETSIDKSTPNVYTQVSCLQKELGIRFCQIQQQKQLQQTVETELVKLRQKCNILQTKLLAQERKNRILGRANVARLDKENKRLHCELVKFHKYATMHINHETLTTDNPEIILARPVGRNIFKQYRCIRNYPIKTVNAVKPKLKTRMETLEEVILEILSNQNDDNSEENLAQVLIKIAQNRPKILHALESTLQLSEITLTSAECIELMKKAQLTFSQYQAIKRFFKNSKNVRIMASDNYVEAKIYENEEEKTIDEIE